MTGATIFFAVLFEATTAFAVFIGLAAAFRAAGRAAGRAFAAVLGAGLAAGRAGLTALAAFGAGFTVAPALALPALTAGLPFGAACVRRGARRPAGAFGFVTGLDFNAGLAFAFTAFFAGLLTAAFFAAAFLGAATTCVRRCLAAGLAATVTRDRLCLSGATALAAGDRRCCGAFCSKAFALDFKPLVVALAVDLAFRIKRSS